MTAWTTVLSCFFLVTLGARAAAAADEVGGTGWRSDLPWDDLKAKLSSSATLIDTGYKDFAAQCIPEFVNFEFGREGGERSTYALINQDSGLCLPHLSCAYEKCNPRPSVNSHANLTFDQYEQDENAMLGRLGPVPDEFNPAVQDSYFNDPSNPSLDLPTKVVHPVTASDVVAIVNFAKDNNIEISLKNSGHSWQGASSKKNTLHINMNRYTQYAATGNGITVCDPQSMGIAVADDLSDQACQLSVAKNKPGVIRVGGGENWDKTYRAVQDANEAQVEGGEKYHVVGGASGSVSPFGWSFQGGLSGDTGGSKFGLGADQIVQMEMVLPNGYHVKFGPTKWEDASAEGFIVPKTTAVSGLCRSNPEEQDEEEWIWEDCPDDFDVDFMDLWYAVRGGGGGTYGVALSMHLQLHDFARHVEYLPSSSEECVATIFKDAPLGSVNFHPIMVEFFATYVMTPSVLNVTEEQSRACGSTHMGNMPMCYGEENVSQAWLTFLEMKNITEGADCLVRREFDGFMSMLPNAPGTRFEGQIPDTPPPGIAPGGATGLLIPRSWVEKVGVQSAMDMFGVMFAGSYYPFGSAAVASDQANSVSQAHRDAGVMILGVTRDEAFWRDIAPELYDFSDPTKFPPMFGSNHAANGLTGPLKDDWTKSCPNDWTFEERLAGCVSFQESIYGTDTLKRLEAIKKVIDPNNMFQCHNCVGTNPTGRKDEEASEPNQEEDIVEKEDGIAIKDDGAGSGSSSSYLRKSSLVIAMMMEYIAVNCFAN